MAIPTLADVNGDSHPDLVVTVRDEAIVYVNQKGQFVLLAPAEPLGPRAGSDP